MKKQIASNLFSSYAGKAVGILLGLFIVPFLIHKLGPGAFGVTVLAESIIALVEVATLSMRTALSRHLTFALSRGDTTEFREYLSTGRFVLMRSAVVVLAIALAVTAALPLAFNVPPGLATQSRLLFLFMSLAFAATIPNSVYWAVLYAKQRFDLINFSTSAGLALRAAIIFAAFSFLPPKHVNLATYGLIYLVMTWVQNAFIYYWHRRVMPGVRIAREYVNRSRVRDILSFGFLMSINSLNSVLYDSSMQILINVVLGPAANAVFAVSLKFSTALKRIFQQTTWTLTPTFTDLVARDDGRNLRRLVFGSMKLTAIVSVPICAFLIVFSKEIVHAWVGDRFALAAAIMPIHVAALALTLPLYSNGCLFNAYAKLKVPCLLSLTSTVFLVLAGVLLMKVFGLGLVGLAIADAAMTGVYLLGFSTMYVRRITGFKAREYLVEPYLKPVAFAAAVWGTGFVLARWALLGGNALAAGLCVAAVAAAYVPGAFAFVLDKDEKEMLRRYLRPRKESPARRPASAEEAVPAALP